MKKILTVLLSSFILASCSSSKQEEAAIQVINTPEKIDIPYKVYGIESDFVELNSDFSELSFHGKNCQINEPVCDGDLCNPFCSKISKYTDQVQFYIMASYSLLEPDVIDYAQEIVIIGLLGVYEKESFNENSYIDFSDELRLSYEDLKNDIVFSNEEVVVINFIRLMNEDQLEFTFADFTGPESKLKDLLPDFVENHLLPAEIKD